MQDPLDISRAISSALNRGEPIVALESCVITHGLPSPENVDTALEMEALVLESGATPATIGLVDGRIRVGLTEDEIRALAVGSPAKIAVRDLPYVISKKLSGGTTVSATLRIASAMGIQVMATGGIGGVHRDYAKALDISADLWELARTPAVVVCSGAKSVADIPATAEWLETHSVPVYGYETDSLPAFYSRSSGIPVSKVDNPCDLVGVLKIAAAALGMRCAAVVGVPIPAEDEIDTSGLIEQAIGEASQQGIEGKALTPFLLKRVGELTGGKSTKANIALLKNNARVAGEIAVALSDEASRRVGFSV